MSSFVGSTGRPEFATNDPKTNESVADAIKAMLEFTESYDHKGRSVAIASAFFNVGGWHLISSELKHVGKVRLMLGTEPQRQTDPVVLRSGSVPARKASSLALDAALQEQAAELAMERNLVPFTAQARGQVADLIHWLRSGRVEVRRYTKEFLHGKAYLIDSPALGVIAGSSNFTYAGLSTNRELNLGQYNHSTIIAVKTWFDDLWDEAEFFDLAAFYEEQVVPDEPWIVFLRMLWEAYGQQMSADDKATESDPSMRNLLEFQKDGVGRARRILDKHNGVLIADEVGLGKTYVGGALVKDTVRARQRVLIVAPKIIRDSVWKPYIDGEHLGGWVDVISYDDLIAEPTLEGRRWRLDVARDPNEYSLVLLDEAHTVRNTDTNRAQALIDILKGNPRKRVVLLTATPVNNALEDLHSLLSYFIIHDDEFAEIGIPSLADHFRKLDKLDGEELSPENLFDILDAVAVRRTRRFVRNHYVGQKIDASGATLTFPEPVVRRVDYHLSSVLEGFFDIFAHALGADRDPDEQDLFFSGHIPTEGLSSLDPKRLTLAGYTPSRYRLEVSDKRQRAAEVTVSGLLRSGLLKRFESSTAAFISTCRKMADTLGGLLTLIEIEGRVASGESLRDWVRVDLDDLADLEEWRSSAEYAPKEEFDIAALTTDIRGDIALLHSLANTVETSTSLAPDPKLTALRETLVKILAEAERDSTLRAARLLEQDPHEKYSRDRDDRKVLVFSYFADTVNYLQDHIGEILVDERLAPYRDRVAFTTGTLRKTSGHGVSAGTVSQEEAVSGFAPKSGGAKDAAGKPLAEDRFDLIISTDVLSEGVNLQQAHNIINFDLPWNPMRLVQRHGRVDRIGSEHSRIYLWCFFPSIDLDKWLRLELTLHRKLMKASKSIGQGPVLPGVAGSEDRVFNAKNEQIRALAEGDTSIFLGAAAGLISGEEFRAILRKAIENASLEKRLKEMPWGIGSGFIANDRPPGFVFCSQILDRVGEPMFRFIPLPLALLPSGGAEVLSPPVSVGVPDEVEKDPNRIIIEGVPITIVTDSLTALMMANPPNINTPATLPEEWVEVAYQAWAAAQEHIMDTWNDTLDTTVSGDSLPAVIREAVQHLLMEGTHRNREDVDLAVKVYRRGQAGRVTSIIRGVMHDEALTDRNKTDRLIELVDELGLSAPDSKPKRYPLQAGDVHLIAWMAILPNQPTPTGVALPASSIEPTSEREN
jgi:hypothetical protein